MTHQTHIRLAGAYSKMGQALTCHYCGIRADSWDHFVPVSVTSALSSTLSPISKRNKILIKCCRECNVIAGCKLFKTIGAKRRYIQEQLKRKYKRYLETPDWRDNETEELGWSLRSNIERALTIKQIMLKRIHWRNALVANANSKPSDIGKDSAPVNAGQSSMPKKPALRVRRGAKLKYLDIDELMNHVSIT